MQQRLKHMCRRQLTHSTSSIYSLIIACQRIENAIVDVVRTVTVDGVAATVTVPANKSMTMCVKQQKQSAYKPMHLDLGAFASECTNEVERRETRDDNL